MKAMKTISVLSVAIGALIMATPAQAGIAAIYYSDYPGGTQIGAAVQDDCGNTTFFGQYSDISYYAFVSIPCGSYSGWGYGSPYYTPWGDSQYPRWPY